MWLRAADFGISEVLMAADDAPDFTPGVGTAGYMAPEVQTATYVAPALLAPRRPNCPAEERP